MAIKLKDGGLLFDKSLDVTAAVGDQVNGKGTAIVSTESEDWDGDIVHVLPSDKGAGWDLDLFNKHGRVIWQHNYNIPAIGVGSASIDKSGPRLMMDYEFDMEDTFAAGIAGKYERGILSQWSVGFMATEYEVREDHEKDWWPPYDIYGAKLLEVSAVNIPANPDAQTIEAATAAEFSKSFVKNHSHLLADEYRDSEAITEMVAELEFFKQEMDQRVKAVEAALVSHYTAGTEADQATQLAKTQLDEAAGELVRALQSFGR